MLASNPNKVAYVRGAQPQPRDRPELRRGLEQRSDLRLGIDVRDETAVHGTEEAGRQQSPSRDRTGRGTS